MDIPDAHIMQGRDETEASISCQNITSEQKLLRGVSNLLGIYRQDTQAENIELRQQIAAKDIIIQEQDKTIQALKDENVFLRNILMNVMKVPASKLKMPAKTFITLIKHSQPALVLQRLHELMDNRGGLYVAAVLMKGYWQDKILTRLPTQKEFMSEFLLSGSWRSVSKYLKKDEKQTPQTVSDMYSSICILPLNVQPQAPFL